MASIFKLCTSLRKLNLNCKLPPTSLHCLATPFALTLCSHARTPPVTALEDVGAMEVARSLHNSTQLTHIRLCRKTNSVVCSPLINPPHAAHWCVLFCIVQSDSFAAQAMRLGWEQHTGWLSSSNAAHTWSMWTCTVSAHTRNHSGSSGSTLSYTLRVSSPDNDVCDRGAADLAQGFQECRNLTYINLYRMLTHPVAAASATRCICAPPDLPPFATLVRRQRHW